MSEETLLDRRTEHDWIDEGDGIPKRHRPIPSRGTYVAAWCPWLDNPEADLDRDVKHRGEPMGFKVRDVLPERRFAIRLSGETLPDEKFEEWMRRWQAPLLPEGSDPDKEPLPRVERFVKRTLDPTAEPSTGRTMEIGFDPLRGRDTVQSQRKYDQEGRISERYLEELRGDRKDEKTALEQKAKTQILTDLLHAGELTPEQYAEKMQALVLGGEKAPETPSDQEAASCGRLVTRGYVRQHEARCNECKALARAEQSERERKEEEEGANVA